ncbi:transposase [Streptosporangium saharense]|uniref:transposase n=1 Tax=Streptosporangium saharense TaxID=1706840 RepID=UPI0036A9EA81
MLLAAVAGRLPALADGVLALRALGGPGRHPEDPGRAAPARPYESRAGGGTVGGGHRHQSVKGADTVGADTRGYDANKKINGRKRFVVTDTLGLLLAVMVRPAGIQDRARARSLLLGLYLSGACRVVFADQGFAGQLVAWARQVLGIVVHIVAKPADQRGFQVHPKRWVVERALAWLMLYRRLVRDYERQPPTSEAMIRWAAINTLLRRITRGCPAQRPGPRPIEWVR